MYEDAMGRNQGAIVDDPITRKGIELWLERVYGAYGEEGGGVDVEVIGNHLILNAKTKDYIYSDFTPAELEYKRGSRPLLERVVAEHVRDGMRQRDIALALMRRCRDNRDHGLAKPHLFLGGNEEELLKRGALMCNEISRVYACLCQVAGLRCRLFSAHISGHMMNEVEVDGRWWWIDAMKGMCAVDENDEPLSAWQIMQDPTVFERQPEWVVAECRPPSIVFGTEERDPRNIAYGFARSRDCYFHPREANAVANYLASDHTRYTYPWFNGVVDAGRREKASAAEDENRKLGGWPGYYFDKALFDPASIAIAIPAG